MSAMLGPQISKRTARANATMTPAWLAIESPLHGHAIAPDASPKIEIAPGNKDNGRPEYIVSSQHEILPRLSKFDHV